MNKYQNFISKSIYFLLMLTSSFFYAKVNQPPVVTAEGNQVFCPGSSINIVTDFTITDEDDTTIDSFYIQISSGYQVNFDRLDMTGNHPNISAQWNNIEGKLSLNASSSGAKIALTDLEKAVKEVIFKTTATTITVEKTFSLTIDDANYLPLTDHFYQFIPKQGITWEDAKIAAEAKTYYGRTGYLATLISAEEASFAGEQASGAGWIGGADTETEGEWKWVTGPEAGTVFWRGAVNGSTPNFAFWNENEPNDFKGNNPAGEDYAHITDPSIGMRGAWNDLPNEGGTGLYIPRGYIVEYGTPEDLPLKIAASTRIYIPKIINTTSATICESGVATISATASNQTICWYDAQTGGTLVSKGNEFTTPELTTTTTYFATIFIDGCQTLERIPVEVVVNKKPTIINITEDLICGGKANLSATASKGTVNWYETLTSSTPIFTGNNFETPALNTTTTYYAEADVSGCVSVKRTAVTASVNVTIPDFEVVKNNYFICVDAGFVVLETDNPLGSYTYMWKKEDVIIASSSSSITVKEPGIYTVKAISLAGCESEEKNIVVSSSNKAIILNEHVIIVDNSTNNTIQVVNNELGLGDYEFSLDDEFGVYKDVGFFQNITTGIHTLFVKDKNGCGTTFYQFSILAYPKYFTPNGDGKNDVWKIDGFNSDSFTIVKIAIYNRFGVLLHQIDASSQGWDGRCKGKIMPSNTYWFRAVLNDGNGREIEKTGNISLLRK